MILTCEPVPGLSDHDAVLVTFQTYASIVQQNSGIVHLYKLADWDKIREELSNMTETYFDLIQIRKICPKTLTDFGYSCSYKTKKL